MKDITTEGCDLALEIGSVILKYFKKKEFPITFSLVETILKNKKLIIKW